MNDIYLRRKNKIILQENIGEINKSPASIALLGTTMKNMQSLGYIMDKDLISAMQKLSDPEMFHECTQINNTLEDMVGDRDYDPMYPNFPQQVADASDCELYINAMVHYLSYGTLLPKYEKEVRPLLADIATHKVISLGSKEDYEDIFRDLVSSNASLSDTDKRDLIRFFENKDAVRILPDVIPNKENMATVSALIFDSHEDKVKQYVRTATDVLRVTAALSEGDVSLSENTPFKKFTRKERKQILRLLENNCGHIEEDMLRHKNKWIRVGEILHPAEYSIKYPKANEAFHKLRNNIKIRTFNSELEKAISDNNSNKALSLLKTRPGEFARRLDSLFRKTDGGEEIIKSFSEVVDKVSTPVLLQVTAHFKNREQVSKNPSRVFFPKGRTAKVSVIENKLKSIPQEYSEGVVRVCEEALKERFSSQKYLGKVYIDEELKNIPIPMTKRSDSEGLRIMPRGAKEILNDETKTVRCFVYWENLPEGHKRERVDVDLSSTMYDKEWNYKGHISWTELKDMGCFHSGDITNAFDGASEFIDINMDALEDQGVSYVLPNINVFTQQKFKDIPNLCTGWMMRQAPNTGEIYDPQTVANKVNIVSNSSINVPFILDVENRQIIYTDINVKGAGYANRVEKSKNNLALIGEAIISQPKPNLHELYTLHAEARGQLCQNKEDADIVFSVNEGITPFDVEVIHSEYMAEKQPVIAEEKKNKLAGMLPASPGGAIQV